MINRALIRARALQVAYAHYHREEQKLATAESELRQSLSRTYDLYLYLLRLPVELTERLGEIMEVRSRKHLATESERQPNKKILHNALVQQLATCEPLETWYNSFALSWAEEDLLLRHLIECIERSELYTQYLKEEQCFESDRDFWVGVFHRIVAPNARLAEYLEMQCIYWDDELAQTEKVECEEHPELEHIDELVRQAQKTEQYAAQRLELGGVEIVKDFVEKSLKRATEEASFADVLLPEYRDQEDELFATHLLRQLLLGYSKHVELIDKHISENWERERLADIDLLIIHLAVVEFLHFPSIPAHITINEYVELSKHYSTPKSSGFVNGVLDAIAKELKSTGKILKQ